MSFARGGYIRAKQWPYGIDDLELIEGVYQKVKKPHFQLKVDTKDLEEMMDFYSLGHEAIKT